MANHSTGAANNGWRGGPVTAICQMCGSGFIGPRWELKRRKYCSRACYHKSQPIPGTRNCRPHVKVVEKMLGRRLPEGAVIHHVDEDRKNNRNDNLVLCQDQPYHLLIHARARVLAAGGNPRTEKICSRCHTVKRKDDFHTAKRGDGYRPYCKECQSIIAKEHR